MGKVEGDPACVSDGANEGAASDGFAVEFYVDEVGFGMIGGEGDETSSSADNLYVVGDFALVDGDFQLAFTCLARVD